MKKAVLILSLVFCWISSGAFCETVTGELTKDKINIRTDATIQSKSLCLANKGTQVEILEEKFEWYKIRLPKYFKAYVWAKYIDTTDTLYGKVNATDLNIRLKPSLDAYIVGKAKKGDTIRIISRNGDWCRVRVYPYGWGWINKQFVRKNEGSKSIEWLIESLNEPSFVKKARLHHKLIAMGNETLSVLHSHISSETDAPTTYSLIHIVTNIYASQPKKIDDLFEKIDSSNINVAAIYLDIIQNIVKPQYRLPYYYYSQQAKLTPDNIKSAKAYLLETYKQIP